MPKIMSPVRKYNPTVDDVHVNQALTNISVAFFQEATGFIADKVFPVVPVQHKTDFYWQWNRGDMNRNQMEKAGPGSEAPIMSMGLLQGTYRCDVWKLAGVIDDQERANADSQIELDASTTGALSQQALINRDVEWINKFFVTGKWHGSSTGGDLTGVTSTSPSTGQFTQFNNFASSDPVGVIEREILNLERTIGKPRSMFTMTIGPEVWSVIRNHPEFISRYQYVRPAIMTQDLVAAIWGIKQILVPNAIYNTANEGDPATTVFITGKNILISYAPDAPAIRQPSAGYTFAWSGLTGSQNGIRMKRYREERRESDFFEIQSAFDPSIVSDVCGVFLTSVVP